MIHIASRFFTASLLSLLFVSAVSACVCGGPGTVTDEFAAARAVFSAKYLGSEYRAGIRDEMVDTHLRVTDTKQEYTIQVLRFEVVERFKGGRSKEMILRTSNARLATGSEVISDCEVGFERGKKYLVYAYGESEGLLATGACTRTRLLRGATKEIAHLRRLRKSA